MRCFSAAMEDWINSVRSNIQEIFEQKCVRESSPQDGPLLLSWMLANYAIDSDNMDVLNRFRPFGIKAIQLDVFHYLRDLMNCEMFQEETHYAEVVQSSVYNLLTLVCAFVDEDRLSALNGIFDAMAATVKFPECAARFWNERNDGLWPIYKVAAELYPYKSEPLTSIAIGLASTTAKKVIFKINFANYASTPFTPYTCLHISTPIYALYMSTYFYAHIRPIHVYIKLSSSFIENYYVEYSS